MLIARKKNVLRKTNKQTNKNVEFKMKLIFLIDHLGKFVLILVLTFTSKFS